MSNQRPRVRIRRVHLIVAMISAALFVDSGLPHRNVQAESDDAKARDAQESEETTRLIKAEQIGRAHV
jgi:hypothetical protein